MNYRVIVCYPAGSGGSFVSGALQSVIENSPFPIDPIKAHCHNCAVGKLPNIVHGDGIVSFEQELQSITQTDFSGHTVWQGHYRNFLLLRNTVRHQLGRDCQTYFVKIAPDVADANQVRFTSGMLKRKVHGVFLDTSDDEMFSKQQAYLRAWYWTENWHTKKNTLTLSLKDIFVGGLADKICTLLDVDTDRLDALQDEYLSHQHRAHKDLIGLLT